LGTQHRLLEKEVLSAVADVVATSQFILGDELCAFENEFALYCDAAYCIGVANGTDALHLSLRALDIGPGDEVITVANTFVATVFAIVHAGAVPVLVDVESDGYNIDTGLIEDAITARTKAIIPVHLYGHPVEMDQVMAIARSHGLKVVEDACQAHGARYRGQRVGSFGDAACFSFYPGKNLGALGDGGAIVTSDSEVAERLRILRHCGQSAKNVHPLIGYNSRLDTLQAAVLRIKLRHLDRWNERRRAAARLYTELLEGAGIALPTEHPSSEHVYHLYVIEHEQRDALLDQLASQGISCGIHYPLAVNEQEPFKDVKTFPDGAAAARARSRRILSLPMSPHISDEQIQKVARAVIQFGRK
jgi:dTDP-4-amino-4,6-dideoxygalactose transaminase